MKPLSNDIKKLIEEHTHALGYDSMDNQYNHLVLLEALVKVGLSQVGPPIDQKDKIS